jgi:hypothetical protein
MSEGDFVLGTCTRKVQKQTLTGLVKNEKKRINVLVKIKVSLKYITICINGRNLNMTLIRMLLECSERIPE